MLYCILFSKGFIDICQFFLQLPNKFLFILDTILHIINRPLSDQTNNFLLHMLNLPLLIQLLFSDQEAPADQVIREILAADDTRVKFVNDLLTDADDEEEF